MEPPSPTKPEADQGSNGAAAPVRGPEPTEPGERILLGLSQVAVALKSQAWRDALPKGINPTQAQILVALNGASALGEEGGLRLSALAERLAVSAPTVSDSVRALVEKGLVVKQKAHDDGRALALALTDHGRELAADLAKWPPDLLASTVPLDAEEQGVLLRSLQKVIRELQLAGRIAPARICHTCAFFRPNVHDDDEAPHHCAFVDAPFGDRALRMDCPDHQLGEGTP